MTRLLQQAFETATKLSENSQDAIASRILEEIEDEKRWTESFAASQDLLSQMAREALEEHRSGKTIEGDW